MLEKICEAAIYFIILGIAAEAMLFYLVWSFQMINRETLIHNFVCGIPIKWKDQKRLIRSVERFEGTSGHEFFVRFWDGEKGFIKTYTFDQKETPPMAIMVRSLS